MELHHTLEQLFSQVENSYYMDREDQSSAPATVGIIGGGTAGYLSALALAKYHKNVKVTLIESPSKPPIGVGEATVTSIVPFLHQYLGLDIVEFFREVQPTFKLGIKFDWGTTKPGYFHAPFDWDKNNIGLRGSIEYHQHINYWNEQSLMMEYDRVPVFQEGDVPSLLPYYRFAYHLDNARLLAFLKQKVLESGVSYFQEDIANVVLKKGDQQEVDYVVSASGEQFSFDYFVDASGFRSLILEKAMHQGFISFDDSLFTDRAVTFKKGHEGKIKPYTTAKTMDHGWCWIIPTDESDHCGYVYADRFADEDKVRSEIQSQFGNVIEGSLIKFRSGRHERFWVGNTVAIGNSFGFVEPLESTGILMITLQIYEMVKNLRVIMSEPSLSQVVNERVNHHWDQLKWFLAIHFKFNEKVNSPFWEACRNEVDVSGISQVLDVFKNGAPLTLREDSIKNYLTGSKNIPFYGLHGTDCILLGQNVATNLLPYNEGDDWKSRLELADDLVKSMSWQAEALELLQQRPELLTEILKDEQSWIYQSKGFI